MHVDLLQSAETRGDCKLKYKLAHYLLGMTLLLSFLRPPQWQWLYHLGTAWPLALLKDRVVERAPFLLRTPSRRRGIWLLGE